MSKKKNKKKTLLDKLLYYFVIFILGAITGYIYEVIFYYITLGVLNNWGILYGPWLPIYGVGAVFLSMLKPLKKNAKAYSLDPLTAISNTSLLLPANIPTKLLPNKNNIANKVIPTNKVTL